MTQHILIYIFTLTQLVTIKQHR